MDRVLSKYLSGKNNRAVRFTSHFIFWILIISLNWQLLYGNFPNIGWAEAVFFLGIALTNIPIYYFLSTEIKKGGLKTLTLGIFLIYFIYLFSTYYFLHFSNVRFPNSFYISRWRSDVGELSLNKLFKGPLFAHAFGTNIVFILIPLSAGLVIELFFRAFHRKQLEEQNLQLELDYLRSQVNPHFLFNTLNNIYGLVLENQKASESILKLADLMRYSLYETGDNLVLLERELKFIQEYIDLERLRLNKEKRIDFELEGKPDGLKIKPLILVTFIENAIKHGLGKSNSAAFVEITIRLADQELLFVCMNSIPEKIQISETPKEEGIGLKNTKRRLDHYYRSNYSLRTHQTEKSYKLELRMHLDY